MKSVMTDLESALVLALKDLQYQLSSAPEHYDPAGRAQYAVALEHLALTAKHMNDIKMSRGLEGGILE